MTLFDLSNLKGSILRYFLFFGILSFCYAGTFPESPGNKDDFHFYYSNEPSTKYDSIANYDDFQIRASYHPVNHFAFDFWFIEDSLTRSRDLALGIRYELPFSNLLQASIVPNIGFVWNDFIGGHKHYRSKLLYFKWELNDLSFLIGHGKGQVWNKLILQSQINLPYYLKSKIDYIDNQLSLMISNDFIQNKYVNFEPAVGYNFQKEQLILNVSSKIYAENWHKRRKKTSSQPLQFYFDPEWKNALGTEFGELESQVNLNNHLILDYFINIHGIFSSPIYKSQEFKKGGVYEPHIVSEPAISYFMITKNHTFKKFAFKYGFGNTFYDRTTVAFQPKYSNDHFELSTLIVKYFNKPFHLTQKSVYKPTDQVKLGFELGQWSFGDKGIIIFINKNFNYFEVQPELGYSKTNDENGIYFMSLKLNLNLDINYSNNFIKVGLHPNLNHKQSTSLLLKGKHGTRNFIRPNRLKSLDYFTYE